MEVVTKVACGSVIAGGGGAAGAYGVHRWSASHEAEAPVSTPSERETEVTEGTNETDRETGNNEGTRSQGSDTVVLSAAPTSQDRESKPGEDGAGDQQRTDLSTQGGSSEGLSGAENSANTEGQESSLPSTTVTKHTAEETPGDQSSQIATVGEDRKKN